MNYFFGFDSDGMGLREAINWIFTINHFFLVLFVIATLFALYFGLHAKSRKGIIITKIVLASIMFVFETGRIAWNIGNHLNFGHPMSEFRWIWIISFQMCALMKWTSMVTLVLSIFLKPNNKVLQIMFNILMGGALIGGALAFIYPDMISGRRSMFHFTNFQTVMSHILLIFVPLYFIKIGEFKVRFKNLWKVLFGYIAVASIAMSISQVMGERYNFAFTLRQPLLEDAGLNLPFPLHLIVTFTLIFTLVTAMYGIFELVHRKRHGKGDFAFKPWAKKLITLPYIIMISSLAIAVILLLALPLMFPQNPVENALGFLCFFPLVLAITGLIIGNNLLEAEEQPTEQATE